MRKYLPVIALLLGLSAPDLVQAQAPSTPPPPTPALAPSHPVVRQVAPPAQLAPAPAPVVAAPPAPAPAVEAPPVAAPLPPAQAQVQLVPVAPAAPQQEPPAALPPPPPGYEYVTPNGYPNGYQYQQYQQPVYDPQRREQLYGQLRQTDGQIANLKQESKQVHLGAPIALMATGYGVMAVSALVALGSFATAESIEHDTWHHRSDVDFNNNGKVTKADERSARSTARVAAGVAAIGLGVGVGGTVMFAKRMSQRHANKPQLHDLKERRRDLMRELRYSANVTPQQAQVTLGGKF